MKKPTGEERVITDRDFAGLSQRFSNLEGDGWNIAWVQLGSVECMIRMVMKNEAEEEETLSDEDTSELIAAISKLIAVGWRMVTVSVGGINHDYRIRMTMRKD